MGTSTNMASKMTIAQLSNGKGALIIGFGWVGGGEGFDHGCE